MDINTYSNTKFFKKGQKIRVLLILVLKKIFLKKSKHSVKVHTIHLMVLRRIPLNIYSKIILYVYMYGGGGGEQINDIMSCGVKK